MQKKYGDKITIAKLDATANEFDRTKWSVSGYPTLFFKPAGGKPQLYEGGREVDEMEKYILANAKGLKKKKKATKKKAQSKKKQQNEEDDAPGQFAGGHEEL